MNNFIQAIEKMKLVGDIISHCRFNPQALELEYAMALDIADVANVEIAEVLEFVKKLSTETKYTYEECIEYARKYFVSGNYKIYSPDKYSLFISQDYLFIIPDKNGEPIKIIK